MTTTKILAALASVLVASTLAGCSAGVGGEAGATESAALDTDPADASGAPAAASIACGTLACDGATQYCRRVLGGMHPLPGHPSSGSYACVALPDRCLATPTCACVAPGPLGAHTCNDANGVVVTILAP